VPNESHDRERIRESYDRLADEYTRRIAGELAGKPFDRALLDALAERVKGVGQVCDVGCGPGHIAAYLHARGADVCGIDISPGMIAEARALNPAIEFRVGDFTALDAGDGTWAAIVAFYSLIHLEKRELVRALRELHRVVRPRGLLVLSFHVGNEVRHFDALWERPVNLDFRFFEVDEMREYLDEAGFEIESVVARDAYPGVEVETRRCYITAVARLPEARP
jgi:SAM-dependent methyltransferase